MEKIPTNLELLKALETKAYDHPPEENWRKFRLFLNIIADYYYKFENWLHQISWKLIDFTKKPFRKNNNGSS